VTPVTLPGRASKTGLLAKTGGACRQLTWFPGFYLPGSPVGRPRRACMTTVLALAPLSNLAAAWPGRLAPGYALAVPRRRRIDQVADHGHRPGAGTGLTGHAGAGAVIADNAGAARRELAGNWPSRPAASPHRESGLPAGTALIKTG